MNVTPITAMPAPTDPKREASDQLEQAFLEEMLKYCGPRTMEGSFSGGAGEDQFGSFLTAEYAAVLAEKLDLGLRIGGQA